MTDAYLLDDVEVQAGIVAAVRVDVPMNDWRQYENQAENGENEVDPLLTYDGAPSYRGTVLTSPSLSQGL